jgi:hypothetical protein
VSVNPSDLERNYTAEVKSFYDDRLHRLGNYARQWPVKVAFSKVGRGHPTHNEGARQCHLVCWLESGDGRTHCGQGVSVLSIGPNLYSLTMNGITQAIQGHIMQCHSEVINNVHES